MVIPFGHLDTYLGSPQRPPHNGARLYLPALRRQAQPIEHAMEPAQRPAGIDQTAQKDITGDTRWRIEVSDGRHYASATNVATEIKALFSGRFKEPLRN